MNLKQSMMDYFTSGMSVLRFSGLMLVLTLFSLGILFFAGIGWNVYKVVDTAHYSDANERSRYTTTFDTSSEYTVRYCFIVPMITAFLAMLVFSFHMSIRLFSIEEKKTRVWVGTALVISQLLGIGGLFLLFAACVVGSFGFPAANEHVSSSTGFQAAMAISFTCFGLYTAINMYVMSM